MKKTIYKAGAVGALFVAASLAIAPAATAAPVTTSSSPTQVAPRAATGDGVWAPSHDEALAIIPLCQPLNLLNWLNQNFTDHGNDIAKFITANLASITGLLNGSSDPYAVLRLLLQDVLQVPVYAVNDTNFHIPATVGDILSFCESARS
ncbi:hypothetical protein FHU41_001954 [Psychromicrobium silvestre]|uniref:Uncharacterized protein n=1 Tax=Psychromicrobium silvestre TaxID=1645614 RepID=A0A7Y9S6W9_9MICC|nr:hypothetical protein [Psychromicrobium silvestre]NYE95704.1 hypothetical protein [Psychromicrobium silvestre]